MIAALWAFTGETIIELFGECSYVQRTGVTGITEHYAEKQTPMDDPDPGKKIHHQDNRVPIIRPQGI